MCFPNSVYAFRVLTRCRVMLVQVMAQRALADAMELMAKAMAQEAMSRTADRVAQEARRGGEDEL
ncbi:hypothetical protein A2U01_0083114, partial [Trifolium medium]|nr:hypothetical protein [Trifolium medium]